MSDMDLVALRTRLAAIREVPADPTVLRELLNIYATLTPLEAPGGDGAALHVKAALLRKHLAILPFALPPGTPEAVVKVGREFTGQVWSTRVISEVERRLDQLVTASRDAKLELAQLTPAVERLRARRDLLRQFLATLDALVGRSAMTGGES